VKKILILSDGIPGHFNQSKGIALLISEICECTTIIHQISWRVHFLRSVCTLIARFLLQLNNKMIASSILWMYSPIKIQGYDLIVAAGGNTAPLSAAIKLVFSLPVIQLGSPRGLHSSMFSGLVTVEQYFDHPSNIVAAVTPNLYSPAICKRAAHEKNLVEHILFLIGGEGIGYSYSTNEWENMLLNIQNIHSKMKYPISIVTSRRTSPEVEVLFQSSLKNILGNYSAWFHQGDKNFKLDALLGSAKNIFVTEDSAMMISESISSGKPVTTLYPSRIQSPKRYEQHLSKYSDLGLIDRQPLSDFHIASKQDLNQKITEYRAELANKLMQRVRW